MALAGISTDALASHQKWAKRLAIPFPLLSDPEGRAGDEFGLVRRLGVGGWAVELFRRATVLAGADGVIAGAWTHVKIRGHAQEVLTTARALAKHDQS